MSAQGLALADAFRSGLDRLHAHVPIAPDEARMIATYVRGGLDQIAPVSPSEMLRAALMRVAELEKTAPDELERLVVSLVAHLRSWRPESVSPLETLPEPMEPVCDPRSTSPR